MEKLIAELTRLYLPAASASLAAGAAARLDGGACPPVSLASDDGATRAIAIPFRKRAGEFAEHWQRLCDVANLLQAAFEFPAPAVSVCSEGGFVLWLSLAAPVPLAQAAAFLDRLHAVHFPDMAPRLAMLAGPVELPPCLNRDNGKWSAFIHPGMGASFADESGLDMPPPAAGQLAFLEGLRSIGAAEWRAALAALAPLEAPAPVPAPSAAATAPAPAPGLLLADATLDDIVRWLHARRIEPTFRHLLPGG